MFEKLKKLKIGDYIQLILKSGGSTHGNIHEINLDSKQLIIEQEMAIINFEDVQELITF